LEKWKEVSFEEMLQSDSPIKCDHWLLSNSENNFGIDLTQPFVFSEFLHEIGDFLTSMNCKSIFQHAKWYIINED
jgi:hypothetical protein